ncbi:MAG: DedA family protein [Planctomycetota bacterium]|nr:DedA family protein [Planctomycetota bacterium]MDA1113998.1 DedA family protein [Planctomycetota bacterium]
MESVLEHMAQNPELWAFLLLVACGLGLPPWSEELVILGSGYFVASGELSYLSAVIWCWAGILAGDTVIFSLGRFVGDRVYHWPVLRSHLRPARRRRFNSSFLKRGTKVVFIARFFPGVRMVAYLVAGNLGMKYWKFVLLDSIGAALIVPISVYIGWKFASNLDHVLDLMHQYRVPLAIVGALVLAFAWVRLGRARKEKLLRILRMRKNRDKSGS